MHTPPDQPAANSGSAQQFVQASISVERLSEAGAQAEIIKAVESLPGVDSHSIAAGKLHVCYDPVQVSAKEIEAAIGRSGHRPLGGEVEWASPFADT